MHASFRLPAVLLVIILSSPAAAQPAEYRLEPMPESLSPRFSDDEIEILAVMDLRRRPGYWRKRLRK